MISTIAESVRPKVKIHCNNYDDQSIRLILRSRPPPTPGKGTATPGGPTAVPSGAVTPPVKPTPTATQGLGGS